MQTVDLAVAAKKASIGLAALPSNVKNEALAQIAKALLEHSNEIIEANKKDLARSEQENLGTPLLKRLKFDEAKIKDVVAGIQSLIGLPEPIGETLAATELDNGLELYKVSCPIGVIGVIFESRPDALVQISTLCLKSGNSALLKGGSEAIETNRILAKINTRKKRHYKVSFYPPHYGIKDRRTFCISLLYLVKQIYLIVCLPEVILNVIILCGYAQFDKLVFECP